MKRLIALFLLLIVGIAPGYAEIRLQQGFTPNFLITDLSSDGMSYLLRDEFVTDRAAGAVNGTLSEPSGHTRTVTDTESKLSISGGALTFLGGKASPAQGDPGFWISKAITREKGRIFLSTITLPATNKSLFIGFDTNTTAGGIAPNLNFYSDASIYSNSSTKVGTYTATTYQTVIALRSSGSMKFIKGGAYTNWTLLWSDLTGSDATLYATIGNYSAAFTADSFRVPAQLWIPAPLASDSFNRDNGGLGITDGAGHAETTGLGSGGSGLAWTDSVGTWAISTNKAMCSALDGGVGIATVDVGTQNVVYKAALTRSAGEVGVVIRYTDANNYIRAYHDGTNAVLVKVVAGTPTTKITGAAAYAAGADILPVADGSYLALYYNNVLVGSVTDAALPTGTRVGIYTTDTGNSIDNPIAYARGTEGQYVPLSGM